jgi:hypothetical protein
MRNLAWTLVRWQVSACREREVPRASYTLEDLFSASVRDVEVGARRGIRLSFRVSRGAHENGPAREADAVVAREQDPPLVLPNKDRSSPVWSVRWHLLLAISLSL